MRRIWVIRSEEWDSKVQWRNAKLPGTDNIQEHTVCPALYSHPILDEYQRFISSPYPKDKEKKRFRMNAPIFFLAMTKSQMKAGAWLNWRRVQWGNLAMCFLPFSAHMVQPWYLANPCFFNDAWSCLSMIQPVAVAKIHDWVLKWNMSVYLSKAVRCIFCKTFIDLHR